MVGLSRIVDRGFACESGLWPDFLFGIKFEGIWQFSTVITD